VDIRALFSVLDDVLVGSLVDGFDFVTTEDDGLDRPVCVYHVINLRRDGRDDSEVMTCTQHAPP
jgi:hypothetical protein